MTARDTPIEIRNWAQVNGLLFDEVLRSFGIYDVQTNVFFIYRFQNATYFSLDGWFWVDDERKQQESDLKNICLAIFDQMYLSRNALVNLIDSACLRIDSTRIEKGERKERLWFLKAQKEAASDWKSIQREVFIQETTNFKSWDFFELGVSCTSFNAVLDPSIVRSILLKQTRLGHRETNRNLSGTKYVRQLVTNAQTFREIQVG